MTMLALATSLLFPVLSPAPTAQETPLLSLWVDHAADCFRDPKDAAFLRALALVDDRVMELPGEVRDFQVPPEVVSLAARVLTGRKSLRILATEDVNAILPVVAQLELSGMDEASARETSDLVLGLLRMTGLGVGEPGANGLSSLQVPLGVPVQAGPHGDAFVLSVGKQLEPHGAPQAYGLPKGTRPALSLNADVGRTLELVSGLMSMGSPEEAEILMRVADTFGLNGLSIEAAVGSDGDRSHSYVRLPGYASVMRDRDMLPAHGVRHEDLARIPADATWATLSTWNPSSVLDLVLAMAAEDLARAGVEDPIESLAAMTGFHLKRDLLDNLGSVIGCYASDTTGGGGILSMVAFCELSNAEGMLQTIERLQTLVDGLGQAQAEGYVRTRSWQHGDADMISLVFPGLPVPVEPTIAILDGNLMIGITPQALVAALDHAAAGGKSLLDHEGFVAEAGGNLEGALGVQYYDAARMARDGYGLTSLVCSAVVNGTRSRTELGRDAGIVIPPFHAFVDGVTPSVTVSRIEGDDLVARGRSDRSLLVNLSSMFGALTSGPTALIVPVAMAGALGTRVGTMRSMTYEEYPYTEEDWQEDDGWQDDDGR